MPITRVRLPSRAKAEFAQAVIDDVRRNLCAADCQLCGAGLGVRVPALTVMEFGDVAHAMLHHDTCDRPRWIGGTMIVPPESFLTYHVTDLRVPSRVTGGRADSVPVNLPVLMVNPSLEAVYLRRDDAGNWAVDTVGHYARQGLRVGSRTLQLTAVPGSVAHLEAPDDDSPAALTVALADREHWLAGVHSVTAADIRRLGGVALIVTTAVDPHSFEPSRVEEEYDALLDSGSCAVGWIPLAGAHQGPAARRRRSERSTRSGRTLWLFRFWRNRRGHGRADSPRR